jgi:hypothetical protein
MTRASLETAGELLSIGCSLRWVAELMAEGAAGELRGAETAGSTVSVEVERSSQPFGTRGWEPLTRGAWCREGEVVVHNACTSGFDLRVRCFDGHATFAYRWRPPPRDLVVARLLRSRFHLLARALLIQYPALWWAGARGRAPLHASACATGASTPLLSAAGGIGRSTLIMQELRRGGRTTGDNLAVGDGTTLWGLVEPMRVEGGNGRRMPHGRNEALLDDRAGELAPDSVVVIRRGDADVAALVPCSAETATRSLVASTYMAGELRRFWSLAAVLSAGTTAAPPHPPVEAVASQFADRLPCFSLVLARTPGTALSDLITPAEIAA